MMTAHEVAEHYGVSDAFMVRALAKIGFRHAKPETALPTPTVARFEAEFGNKIRAARPKPQPAFTAESDAAPTASRAVRKPTPHVMRVAHARVTGTRLPNGMRVKALLADPGPVHAIDAAGTRDGDPWRGEVVPGAVHFYGGSIVGTAETMGMTSDRTLFLAAAGAGVGVDDASEWHNRNPDVVRFSMTAPGDFIEMVQGIPGGPHGADPDEMAGVIPLATGRYVDGGFVAGFGAHSGMLNRPSDSWRTILAVITGDAETWQHARID